MFITKKDLEVGVWYCGQGRQGVALWGSDGLFHSVDFKFGHYVESSMEYGARGFDPYQRVS